MSYIAPAERSHFDKLIMDDILPELCYYGVDSAGTDQNWKSVLDYIILKIVHEVAIANRPGYATFNDLLGILESVKQEFYHNVVVPYENKKHVKNGPISILDRD